MEAKMLGLLAMGLVGTSVADAAPFVGEDLAPGKMVIATEQPAIQRTAFEATLDSASVQRESFETTALGGTPDPLLGGAKMTGTGEVTTEPLDPNSPVNRFNTTPSGSNWWESASGFELSLNGYFNGFGFFATDLGDFDATLTVSFFNDMTNIFTSSPVGCSEAATPNACDGSLHFLGFTSLTQFNRVVVAINQQPGSDTETTDRVGFDDLVLGRFPTGGPNPVPEPGTLALLGLGLAGLGLARRRKAG